MHATHRLVSYSAVSASRYIHVRPSPPFFFRLASNAFPDIGSLGRIEKKNSKKKSQVVSEQRPCYPRMTLKVNIYIFGLTKCTTYCTESFLFLFLFFSTLLLCSFFRLKELFQVKNGLSTSLLLLLFFWKCQKFGSVRRC